MECVESGEVTVAFIGIFLATSLRFELLSIGSLGAKHSSAQSELIDGS